MTFVADDFLFIKKRMEELEKERNPSSKETHVGSYKCQNCQDTGRVKLKDNVGSSIVCDKCSKHEDDYEDYMWGNRSWNYC